MKVSTIIQQIKYNALLNRIEWKVKAAQIKKRDNYRCQYCNSPLNLNVHHLVYLNKMPWDYPDNYYITLCNRCHLMEHSCLDNINFDIKEMLLSGMLATDIYKKIKSNETVLQHSSI